MQEENKKSEMYLNFNLFTDVEDEELKARNRAAIMSNIFEDHANADGETLTPLGFSHLVGYFSKIPDDGKTAALEVFSVLCEKKGHGLKIKEH